MYNLRKKGWLSQSGYNYKTKTPLLKTITRILQNHKMGVQFANEHEKPANNLPAYNKEYRFIYKGDEYYINQSIVLDKGPFVRPHLRDTSYYQLSFTINGKAHPLSKLNEVFDVC